MNSSSRSHTVAQNAIKYEQTFLQQSPVLTYKPGQKHEKVLTQGFLFEDIQYVGLFAQSLLSPTKSPPCLRTGYSVKTKTRTHVHRSKDTKISMHCT